MRNIIKSTLLSALIMAGAGSANAAVTVDIQLDGIQTGTIEVTSADDASWTKIENSDLLIPVRVGMGISSGVLRSYGIVQGSESLFASGDYLHPDLFTEASHSLTGSTDYLTGIDRMVILKGCNSKLNVGNGIHQEHTFNHNVIVTLKAQFEMTNGDDYPIYEGHVAIPFQVKCKPVVLTQEIMAQVPDVAKVDLGLSSAGPIVRGTLKYSGSCPMGIALNMYWETSPGGEIKSYVQHKDVTGQHNWTSTVFPVTTNQPAGNGNMEKTMTDLIVIPFAGSTPSDGGQVAQGVPSKGLMAGGSGGGAGPISGVAATNTGTNSGVQKYIGFFRLVAFKKSQTAPAFNFDGGLSNTTLQLGKKYSPWRKYEVACEPTQATVALDTPKGLQNPPKTNAFNPDDAPAFPRPASKVETGFDPATRNLTVPPVHKPNTAVDVVRLRQDAVRKKAEEAEAERKRKAALKVLVFKRKREARLQVLKLKAEQEKARKAAIAVALAKRKAIAGMLARQR